MIKKILLVSVSIALICLVVYIVFEGFQSDYQKVVNRMQLLSIKDMDVLLNNDVRKLVFVGKEGCGGCHEFVKILEAVYGETIDTVAYLNTLSHERAEILSYLDEYGITQVPTLMVIGRNNISFPRVPNSVNEMKKLREKLGQ